MFETVQITNDKQISSLKFKPEQSGLITCAAENAIGNAEIVRKVYLFDLEAEVTAWSLSQKPALTNETVSIFCGASKFTFINVNWYHNGALIENSTDVAVIAHETQYSWSKEIIWNNIQQSAAGHYGCGAQRMDDHSIRTYKWEVEVMDPFKPTVEETNIGRGEEKRLMGDPFEFKCRFDGLPHPQIRWYKDDVEIVGDGVDLNITIEGSKTVLSIPSISMVDEGTYRCDGSNRLGNDYRETRLKAIGVEQTTFSIGVIIGGVSLVLLLTSVTVYQFVRTRRDRRLLEQLKAAGLANFVEGNVDHINPDLMLNDQADLLPYDKSFEFPREQLKLDKQLGAGAFGVVMKATAMGIRPSEQETVVAVKMVKKIADNEVGGKIVMPTNLLNSFFL